jgi:hypothetical protein
MLETEKLTEGLKKFDSVGGGEVFKMFVFHQVISRRSHTQEDVMNGACSYCIRYAICIYVLVGNPEWKRLHRELNTLGNNFRVLSRMCSGFLWLRIWKMTAVENTVIRIRVS